MLCVILVLVWFGFELIIVKYKYYQQRDVLYHVVYARMDAEGEV